MGQLLPLWSIIPFGVLLLSIAVLPLVVNHWWEKNRNKAILSFVLGGIMVAYLLLGYGSLGGGSELVHSLMEYLAFIALLGSLFIISGGVYLKGSLNGTPLSNTVLMAIGAVLANLIGTTGASMVLIRPFLRANKSRERKAHLVVFFIFVVSNCGGLLTPLGDPPLFLGFLKGVPFTWTLHLWKEWLLVVGIVLLVFNFFDQFMIDKEEKERPGAQLEEVMQHEKLGIEGKLNLVFLLGIVLSVLGKGQGWGNAGHPWPFGVQEGLMVGLTIGAWFTTRKSIRQANRFTFHPIIEVAVLFLGIFVTMIPAVAILNAKGAQLGLTEQWHYFWATGMLSSFLDNAPTYLTFAATAAGQMGVTDTSGLYLAELLKQGPEAVGLLTAISCGAVFMGANTYIGNGPNFMVKAIAEENGVDMPSFFGYMFYSMAILLPTFVIVTLVFF